MNSVVIMNLPTYGGGDVWGKDDDDSFAHPSVNDMLLEVVGINR